MDAEEWRSVVGYDGCYEVSNLGRIRSVDKLVPHVGGVFILKKGKIRKPHMRNGYLIVTLKNNNIPKKVSVHRVVAESFIENVCGSPCVDHIDGNPTNNYYKNLRWCTQFENINFPIAKRRRVERCKRREIPVLKFSISGEFICEYESVKSAALDNGVYGGDISSCFSGRRKTVAGFIWIKKQICA